MIALTDAVGLDVPSAKKTLLDAGRWASRWSTRRNVGRWPRSGAALKIVPPSRFYLLRMTTFLGMGHVETDGHRPGAPADPLGHVPHGTG